MPEGTLAMDSRKTYGSAVAPAGMMCRDSDFGTAQPEQQQI